ncbi:MAG: CoA protein activase [Clostridia bacterium]|nr:CoA protein activase [Clostridia bacterium]
MKVTFPHMGNTWVALKGMLEYIGLEVIVPPITTKKTLTLGVQNSPEFACLPLKINIGNFIEAKELGAEAFVMAGGTGPCRFGLYAQLEKEILLDLGYDYKSLVIEPPESGYWQFIKRVKDVVGNVSWWRIMKGVHLGYKKAIAIDNLEKVVQEIRPREFEKGTADRIFEYALLTIDGAKNVDDLQEVHTLAMEKLLHIPKDEFADVIRIGLVGEIYTLLEPFANMNIEKKLGCLGAHVTRSMYLSDWVGEHLLSSVIFKRNHINFKEYAKPFMNHFVGGHALESIGASVAFAKEGYDGIIQVAPLTCMPEIVAHNIFPRVTEKYEIPVINIYVDEQTGEEGLNTRLEAYVDLLKAKKTALTGKNHYDIIG